MIWLTLVVILLFKVRRKILIRQGRWHQLYGFMGYGTIYSVSYIAVILSPQNIILLYDPTLAYPSLLLFGAILFLVFAFASRFLMSKKCSLESLSNYLEIFKINVNCEFYKNREDWNVIWFNVFSGVRRRERWMLMFLDVLLGVLSNWYVILVCHVFFYSFQEPEMPVLRQILIWMQDITPWLFAIGFYLYLFLKCFPKSCYLLFTNYYQEAKIYNRYGLMPYYRSNPKSDDSYLEAVLADYHANIYENNNRNLTSRNPEIYKFVRFPTPKVQQIYPSWRGWRCSHYIHFWFLVEHLPDMYWDELKRKYKW